MPCGPHISEYTVNYSANSLVSHFFCSRPYNFSYERKARNHHFEDWGVTTKKTVGEGPRKKNSYAKFVFSPFCVNRSPKTIFKFFYSHLFLLFHVCSQLCPGDLFRFLCWGFDRWLDRRTLNYGYRNRRLLSYGFGCGGDDWWWWWWPLAE